MDYRLALMCGKDMPIPECELVIHQPTIEEIAMIGEDDFYSGAQCLCINKTMFSQGKNDLSNTNNFQIFMMIIQEKEAADKKFAVQQVLTLLFPNYKVSFTPNSMIMMGPQIVTIDESNFEKLQEIMRLIFCVKDEPSISYNPSNDKARDIAQKLMRGKQRVAELKGETHASIISQYLSTLAVGLQQSLRDLTNLTLFQLYDLIERYSLYINWDIDIRSRLAGGKPDKQPDNWMKNIH